MAVSSLHKNAPFLAFLATQFLGAANDNILKMFLTLQSNSGVWLDTPFGGPGAAAAIFVLFTVPFLLFSSFAGQFADRYSKRSVAVFLKSVEILVMVVAVFGILQGAFWVTLACFVLLSTQSAFFGPAKYGIIPELVAHDDLSRANGGVNMTTNIAVIAGTMLGAFLSAGYDGHSWLPGLALVAVALAGWATSLGISRVPPREPDLAFEWRPWTPIFRSLRAMAAQPALMRVALAWAMFYFLGVMVMAAVPEYGPLLYGDEAQQFHGRISYLWAALMVGIGASCLTAGAVSGDRIRTGLVAPGIFGVAVALSAFLFLPRTFGWALAGFSAVGLCSGFYIIPLQALLQDLAGEESRGRVLGTANFLSFSFMAVGGVVFFALARYAGLPPDRILALNAVVAVAMGLVFVSWRRHGRVADA